MTPNTPAGGAVAWSYEHNFGDDKWETRLTFSQPVESAWNRNIRPLAYAPATVPLDAVRKVIGLAQHFWDRFEAGIDEVPQLDRVIEELEALTRGEK